MGLNREPAATNAGPHERLPGLAVRLTATALLRQVVEHRVPLDSLLDEAHGNRHFLSLDQRDRALVRAIAGTALRRRGEIDAALAAALHNKLPPNADPLAAILHVAVAQILFLDVPDHAAINLAVAQAAGDRRTGRARGLVNAVLREVARRGGGESGAAPPRINTPAWLFERWSTTYREPVADAIAAAHLEPPGLDISVKRDPDFWAEKLAGVVLPTGSVRLAGSHRVADLAGFEDGAWWVQDAAAALPAKLLGAVGGMQVADLCAAPGGKTMALAAAGAHVTAVDIASSRMRRLAENLRRLKLDAKLVTADILAWEPEHRFDAVLLDAPCSATGTIRRHPDIAWLKRPEDIAALARVQERMLDRAASLVQPGGRLIYCTCSLEPEEGETQVAPFLERHEAFRIEPIAASEIAGLGELLTPAGALRTLPSSRFGDDPVLRGMDGFFAARFRRS